MPLSTGQILHNRYRIVKLLGQGGFGEVYRAWDVVLCRPCALKENLDASLEAQAQFGREATILANLVHPNLARVTDYFFLPGQGQYLVMDYVDGEDLQSMLDRTGALIPEAQALNWICQVCDGLVYLHSQNPPIIHRDIKPANIKITPQGKAVLVDFGIAKLYDPRLKTTIGARAVTPGYSPFEQYGQAATDARTDIYALGATTYTLLTGQIPNESIARMAGATLPAPRTLNPSLSSEAERVILRALAVQPADRYQSVEDFAAALPSPMVAPVPKPPITPPPPVLSAPYTSPASIPPAPIAKPSSLRFKSAWFIGIIIVTLLVTMGVLVIVNTPVQPTMAPPASPSEAPSALAIMAPAAQPTEAPAALPSETPAAWPNIAPFPTETSLEPLTGISDIDGMTSLYVPAGEFLMGSTDQGYIYETPQHSVYLDAFWIDQTEVTNAMYKLCVQAGACRPPGDTTYFGDTQYAKYPVVQVVWNDANTYCIWAGRRLPTEAQWEKAAHGPDGRTYPWGEGISCDKANYGGCMLNHPINVGSYPAGESPYSTLDMAGNVWEWVADWYSQNYYDSSPSNNPTGPATGQYRVLRGGSWMDDGQYLRSAHRYMSLVDNSYDEVGFRCSR